MRGQTADAVVTASAVGATAAISARLRTVTLRVNGVPHELQIEPRVTLLDALRERVAFIGTKKGCDRGQCGACTVLVDGRRINSCLTLAVMHEGSEITTIEGLGTPDALHPMQAAFITRDAFQCGYCTPGQICSAVALLGELKAGQISAPTFDAAGEAPRATAPERLRIIRVDDAEIRERQPLPLRRLLEHRRRRPRSGRKPARVNDIGYRRPASVAEAVRLGQQTGAVFVAGGSNLIDLMKGGAASLVDVNHLPLAAVTPRVEGGIRIGALGRPSAMPSSMPPAGACAACPSLSTN